MAAKLEVTFSPASGRSVNGTAMPALDANAAASETLTAANTPSNTVAGPQSFARIANSGDVPLYVAFGKVPNPNASPRWFLGVGQAMPLGCNEGDKVAYVEQV
jgi:hypothetical protein